MNGIPQGVPLPAPHRYIEPLALLDLGATRCRFVWLGEAAGFELPLGHDRIGGRALPEPLSPWAVEEAIQHIEDAITPWARLAPRRGWLAADVRSLARLSGAGLAPVGRPARWPADAVEQAYQRLALRASRAAAAGPADAAQDATVLILRECLHHGGFEGLVAAP